MAKQRSSSRYHQPRLKNGVIRVKFGSRLDPLVKEGLRAIGIAEQKSMSWVVESVIIKFFKLENNRVLRRRAKLRLMKGNRAIVAARRRAS